MEEQRYSSTILNLALDGGEWSVSHPCRFTPGETASGTDCIGGWVGPRAGMGFMENIEISCTYRESSPEFLVVQPIA
jgi:hypothetical protein